MARRHLGDLSQPYWSEVFVGDRRTWGTSTESDVHRAFRLVLRWAEVSGSGLNPESAWSMNQQKHRVSYSTKKGIMKFHIGSVRRLQVYILGSGVSGCVDS